MLVAMLSRSVACLARWTWLLLRIAFAFFCVLLTSAIRAIKRNTRLRPIPPSELQLPLLAARLSDMLYMVESVEDVERAIASLLQDSRLLHYEPQMLMQCNSNWCLCEGRCSEHSERAVFLIFRGTNSPTDAIADVMFRPEPGRNGVLCHGGFLRTVRDDAALHAQLQQHLPGASEFYIFGHSLGGALSQAVAGGGYLPRDFAGRLTIVTLGGPVVFYGEPDVHAFDRPTASARVISVVNSHDVVPRLLGCPLSFTRTILSLFATNLQHRRQREQQEVLDTLEQYRGFPGYELMFLHGGSAYRVAAADRALVLHLAEALHPRCIADHLTYVAAAEAATYSIPWVMPTA